MSAPKLKTEIDTPEMEARIEAAFAVSDYCPPEGSDYGFALTFDHGQWWVESEGEDGTVIYSVVDAAGGRSIDGFDFEALS